MDKFTQADPYTCPNVAADVIERIEVAAKLLALNSEPANVLGALDIPFINGTMNSRTIHLIHKLQKDCNIVVHPVMVQSSPIVQAKIAAYSYLLHKIAESQYRSIDASEHVLITNYESIMSGQEMLITLDVDTVVYIGDELGLLEPFMIKLWESLE